ncbi:diaminobutyrate acetyltransferase [Nocardia sp. SYP-A9097]|uniref:diaminobutyrate acetyltransferase n=1 Tax=Nocardia sp. SYP-A9097 TaxID=2663237 RepID=UPI00129B7180|nr:diaminobutyrate acetyltransferase [Nocardia sp. SYP-A9097]MRH87467.1 diaminobutyrate acetyltransferase [Nocardia sp. SYP-A9097]
MHGESAALLRTPVLDDGARLWRIAANSGVLDTNSSYAYLLWCRDFAATSAVVEIDGEVGGFVIGYLRPQQPGTFFVWQVAVDRAHRGRGLGVAMLGFLLDGLIEQGVSALETTVSPDNTASIAMFSALARRRGSLLTRRPLFDPGHFPDGHEPEHLFRIAPDQEVG